MGQKNSCGWIGIRWALSICTAVLMTVSGNIAANAQYIVTPIDYSRFYWRDFDFFDADDDGTSLINGHLLCDLSFGVYDKGENEAMFRSQMEAAYGPKGLAVDYVFMNSFTGTEGAILSNDDTVFLVFRGTSAQGTPWWSIGADYLGDIDDDFRRITIDQKSCYVHKGFWLNVDSEFSGIREMVAARVAEGKKLWVTGHSLGGANATLAALRLHYQYDIDVQGLHTFGAPKVGDSDMVSMFGNYNNQGRKLRDVTVRWIMSGDPAPTFFRGEFVWMGYKKGWQYKYYRHVGTSNTIYPQQPGQFNFYYDTNGNISYDDFGGLFDEHMWYDDALEEELIQQGYGYVIGK